MGNIRERIDELRELHPLVSTDKGTLIIEGFGGVDETQCFGIVAEGDRYHDYGICSGSYLYCCKTLVPQAGDLVISYLGGGPAVYLFRPGAENGMDGRKRIIGNAEQIYAVVVGAFNFYR